MFLGSPRGISYHIGKYALMALALVACASPRAPTGGPKDETPPSIINEESTANHQTHFKDKTITLTFDEWIKLNDIYSQLIVSPLMPDDPEVKLKGKSIVIKLPDSLREETTYTINFGNAIADLNEGNKLENFSFVFSTGSVLDSSRLSGNVQDMVTGKPADNIWVMLLPVEADSAVFKQKPEYVAKTNKEGKWALANIRDDSFHVVALKDNNLNFLYDQESELIGWLDQTVYTREPVSVLNDIFVFPREKKINIKEIIHPVPGWLKVLVEAPLPKPVPGFLPRIDSTISQWEGDTLHVWYNPVINYSGYAVIGEDSTQVRVSPGTSMLKDPLKIGITSVRISTNSSVQFFCAVPVSALDTAWIELRDDSLKRVNGLMAGDSLNVRRFQVSASWTPATRYTLTFFPGAITDFWGRTNDTIRQSFTILGQDQFGDLSVQITGLDSTKQYIILLKSGEQVLDFNTIDHLGNALYKKSSLFPGKYILELIEDTNGNHAWDTGDYAKRRQPERKKIFPLENLRAGWELEAKISWQ